MNSPAQSKAVLILSGFTILLSSSLLFMVQPLVTKIFLPLYGGSPSVWNTALLFFQLALLAGYLFAHLSGKLKPKQELILYAGVVALAALALPIGISAEWTPDWKGSVTLSLLQGLFLAVGVPFFAISTASPLIQKWFSYSQHTAAKDPYFLYALSNFGSLSALIMYPFLIEPFLTLRLQTTLWSWLFTLFAVCMLLLCFITRKGASQSIAEKTAAPPSNAMRGWWTVLAFIPSSLTLGVTLHVTTDIAAFPLLWIIPLSAYLISFIVAFSQKTVIVKALCTRALPYAIALPALLMAVEMKGFISVQIAAHTVSLFVIAVCSHSALASLRPAVSNLTEYYLLMSAGGALGGIFNSLIAPVVFSNVVEYALVLFIACIFLTAKPGAAKWRELIPSREDTFAALLAASVILAAAPLIFKLGWQREIGQTTVLQLFELGLPALVCVLSFNRRARTAAVTGAMLLFPFLGIKSERTTIMTHRSFFGVMRVTQQQRAEGAWWELWHGSTLHGIQYSKPPVAFLPTAYYAPTSPAGEVFSNYLPERGAQEIALIGLGIGTLAAYGQPDWRLTYYEIDPAIIDVAAKSGFFTYLRNSKSKIRFALGDARLLLERASDKSYDMIVLDAFSSDAIPIHLMTQEAFTLYLSKLKDDGLILMHITNRHLELSPVIAAIASRLELTGYIKSDFNVTQREADEGKFGSKWVALVRNNPAEALTTALSDWALLPQGEPRLAWSDDYSNVVSVLK
ncbi:MAG: fused MFS/spermidine synthase [Deltaproteobacteria bacterium]|nr:fused MFS/spermidine synthase [Deltaproteobacteria bacterium]